MDMESEARYEGEDVRPTSSKEIFGWYAYGWAAEVFVVCGIGSFVPITLEQLARENGVLLSDLATPCTTPQQSHQAYNITLNALGINGTSITSQNAASQASQCVVPFFGTHLNTASFAMYTFSLSVFIQALLLISISAAADHGRYRKSYLLAFAFTGSIATMLMLATTSKVYYLAALLAIVANTCVGASFVLLNSFLPLLVRYHPTVRNALAVNEQDPRDPDPPRTDSSGMDTDHAEADEDQNSTTSATTLLPAAVSQETPDKTTPYSSSPSTTSPALQLSTRISSNGIGIGYTAAVLLQVICFFLVFLIGGSTLSLRIVLFAVGAWWFVFTIPAALLLRPRPGPPLQKSDATAMSWFAYPAFAWRSLGRTILRARRLRDVLFFLAAWFLLSDGIATVSGTAILYAKTTLGMEPAALAMINVIVMIAGVIGALTWSRVSRYFQLRPIQTILACLFVFELIPLYALLAYIPLVQQWGVLGLQTPGEMYVLGAVYGLVLGGFGSYCRALFGELVPPGFEAAFFALYAITDKGSSVFGPAIVGAITDATGDIRPAFVFLTILIGLPIPLLLCVDVDRGRRAGNAMARELEEAAAN